MKLIWYFFILFLIFSILLSHPQKGNLGTLGNEIKILNPTRSTQKGLQILILVSILMFLLLTVLLAINSQVYY